MNTIYDPEEYYEKCLEKFRNKIKKLKTKIYNKEYRELKEEKTHICFFDVKYYKRNNWSNHYKYDPIVFLLFKFYYIIKSKYNLERKIILLFDNFKININDFKYLRILKNIIDKLDIEQNKKISLYNCILFYNFNLLCDNFKNKTSFKRYIIFINTLFFYNFFFTDLNKHIINHIKYNIGFYINNDDKSIIQQYMQPLENILSWSILREIWICLCIFAKPAKFI